MDFNVNIIKPDTDISKGRVQFFFILIKVWTLPNLEYPTHPPRAKFVLLKYIFLEIVFNDRVDWKLFKMDFGEDKTTI